MDYNITYTENGLCLRNALPDDIERIISLYHSVIGTEGCVWNELYPSREDALSDIAARCLFILTDGDDIIGACSVLTERELDSLKCFKISDGTHIEIVRVVVSPSRQGKGLARLMLEKLFFVLKKNGCRSIHLLAAKKNLSAIRLYRSLGFAFLDECFMFENDYYACEKVL